MFHHFQYHARDIAEFEALSVPPSLQGTVRSIYRETMSLEAKRKTQNWTNEGAARHYLDGFLSQDPEAIHLTEPDREELMPSLRLDRVIDARLTDTTTLRFSQTNQAIPIFGSQALVEVDQFDRQLVSFDAFLADPPDVSAITSISAADAFSAIRYNAHLRDGYDDTSLVLGPDTLFFYNNDTERWHLAYYFRKLPAFPYDFEHGKGHGLAGSPRDRFASFDYLVDAHNGEIIDYFSAQPMLDVPTPCVGEDDEGAQRSFFGLNVGATFQMRDPMRNIETYDFHMGDIDKDAIPVTPIENIAADFGSTFGPGVSAHFFATRVFDFYNNVLKRDGVDDKGMKLISIVNVTSPSDQPPPDWDNAVWWNQKMWYGQKNVGGSFESYARYFDVIAHELTHGITEYSSDLVYKKQSGALNESFSDIFGVIIKNWFPNEPNPLSSWDWELGNGLGNGGLPLRDLSDPTRTGDPDHMNDYLNTTADHGGVHTNSNIHNKAAYNLLTATDHAGDPAFSVEEVSILYYLTLDRLRRQATFSDCLRTLQSVAATYFSSNPVVQAEKRQFIADAYSAVGIV